AGLQQDERRLEVGRQIGAERTIVLSKDNQQPLTDEIRALGDGLGVDVVIDATGHSATLKPAMAAVRPNGQITKVGWGPQPLDFSLDPLVGKAARLQGSFSHNYPIWEKVIALMAAGRLDPRPLVGRVEPLAGWQSCFDGMASGEIVKGVLKPASESRG
ncbi:MAG TPA: zinc-binding dehydrogenase, partial [Terriglobia bacterium]|nr:zinc-binding dehydrogenase [Terriglobia bacterium]